MKENKILGLIIMVVGIVLLGNVLNIWDVNLFFDGWWTLFIIIPSLYGYLKKQWVSSTISLLVGIFLLLAANKVINWEIIFPTVLIIVGISFLFKNKSKIDKMNCKSYTAIFSGSEHKIKSVLNDMDITAIFGGVDLNMRGATLENDITIDAICLFGGIDILVPEDCIIVVNGTPIFGGIENKALQGSGKKITINATCVFGGIDIN